MPSLEAAISASAKPKIGAAKVLEVNTALLVEGVKAVAAAIVVTVAGIGAEVVVVAIAVVGADIEKIAAITKTGEDAVIVVIAMIVVIAVAERTVVTESDIAVSNKASAPTICVESCSQVIRSNSPNSSFSSYPQLPLLAMFDRFPKERINWFTSSFLIVTFFVAIIGVPIYIVHHGIDLFQIGLFLFFFIATGLSITVGYHRLFTHMSFKAAAPVKLVTLIFGAAAFEDSALDWASDHRFHHKFVDDEEDDPYSISRGFFWAHMGWIFFKLYPRELPNVGDLRKDPLVMWQHRNHHVIGVIVSLILPPVIGYLYGGGTAALGAFLIAGIARIVFVQHCTFFINSLCHTIGKRPYDSTTSARDSWIMAIFTFGEGYHNYHHSFQHDYRNGVKPWQWDPTKWTIWLLARLGLASDLRRVSEEKIVLSELREMKNRAEAQIAKQADKEQCCPKHQAAHNTLVEMSQQLAESYRELEQAISNQIEVSRTALHRWREIASDVRAQLLLIHSLQPVSA